MSVWFKLCFSGSCLVLINWKEHLYTSFNYTTNPFIMYNYSISKMHVNMIEIILERSNQLVIQLNSLASVPTPLGRTCINRPFYVVPRKSGLARIHCIWVLLYIYQQPLQSYTHMLLTCTFFTRHTIVTRYFHLEDTMRPRWPQVTLGLCHSTILTSFTQQLVHLEISHIYPMYFYNNYT